MEATGLFKYVWPFSGHQVLNDQPWLVNKFMQMFYLKNAFKPRLWN